MYIVVTGRPILRPNWKFRLWLIPLFAYATPIFYRYSSIWSRQESQYELWRQPCGAFGSTEDLFLTLLKNTPCLRMLLGDEEAVFIDQRLFTREKRSCETPHRETSSHLTLVGFGCICNWPLTQFFSGSCTVGWLTDALLVLFLLSIVWNACRRRFERRYLGQMAQRRCHSGCTISLFWFESSLCPSVSLLCPDCSVLQANWRDFESGANFHFPWPKLWSRWWSFLWLRILLALLVLPQLRCPGSCPSRLLDWASQYTLYGKAVSMSGLGAKVTLAKISWTRRSEYTWTSFCPAIGLLGTLCWVFVVSTGRYGSFCDARCPRLQRNAVFGMVESFSGWLGPQQG